MVNTDDFLTGKFTNIDSLYDKQIVEEYYLEKNNKKKFNDRIQNHFENLLIYNKKNLKDMFCYKNVNIDHNLDILARGIFHKRLKYRITISDCEMYLIDFMAGVATPCCLLINNTDSDKEIVDKLNQRFRYALKTLKERI